MRWPKYWSFSFSISPSKEYSGLISFRIDCFDLLVGQSILKSLLLHHNLKASFLHHSAVFTVQFTSVHDYWENHGFDYMDFLGKVISLLFNMLSRLVIFFLPRSNGISHHLQWFSVQFSSVAQSYLTVCVNCSTPGLPVHHQLLEFTQTHVHRVDDAIQPSQPLLSPSPPAPNPSQHQGLFQWVNCSHEVAKVLEFQL